MKLILQIAKTQLLAKIKQSLIAALGVTFGIAMFILMISFMTGVNELLSDLALDNTPHIRMYREVTNERPSLIEEKEEGQDQYAIVHHQKPKVEQKNIKDGWDIVRLMRSDPRVKGVSPQLATQVFYNYGPVQLGGTLSGVDILEEAKFYKLQDKMKSGRIEDLMSTQNGILMGAGLAKKLNVRVGDNVMLATPEGNVQLMKVVGIFRFGIGQLDDTKSYADLSTVQSLLNKPSSYITEIHLKLYDLDQAKEMSRMYQRQFGYKAEDWETANASILMSFVIRNVLTYVVVITMLVVAGFGIYNIMNMTVIDKMKDIAILKATGFNGRDIVRIFITQSVIIGIAGGLVGLLLGFVFSYLLSMAPFDAGEFLSVETFPVSFNISFYIFGLIFGVLTTFLAGYLPARKASKIDPVAILRG